jgi:hypothetical protein
MEHMSAFHNRLASLEAPPLALTPNSAPPSPADDLRHPLSMTHLRTSNLVPHHVTGQPRRPTVDQDLVLATQLNCEGLDMDTILRHIKFDLSIMQPDPQIKRLQASFLNFVRMKLPTLTP